MSCVQTRIANTTDRQLTLALFNGAVLDANEELLLPGDVYAWLAAKFPGVAGLRAIESFVNLVDTNVLSVTLTPASTCGETYNSSSGQFVG